MLVLVHPSSRYVMRVLGEGWETGCLPGSRIGETPDNCHQTPHVGLS